MKKFLFVFAMLCVAPIANAAPYTIDYTASKVAFSGTHADNKFEGKFDKWTAEIDFDAAKPEASHMKASFDLSTAKTGNAMYDGTLPEKDWFDIKEFPKAEFVSTSVKANPDKSYAVTGNLTIRNITHPVTFNFTLSDVTKTPVKASGHFAIDRLSYDLGKKSDDKAEWVGKDITISMELVATPAK
jgi:polyisoprenoid-binding protein YceI